MEINTVIREARMARKMSRAELASRIGLSPRTIEAYEAGKQIPPADVVLAISRECMVPWLTQLYCRECCPIGRKYSYEVLGGVNLDPQSVVLKLVGELEEVRAVLGRMQELLVNKNSREDFSEAEWREFTRCLAEFLDVEHVVECLKISLGYWVDVGELIREHNDKCWQRGYVQKKKTALQAAI